MRAPFAATGVSIDTRTLQPGDLFVALVGENGDGHDHVAAALAKGAAGALVHRDLPGATLLRGRHARRAVGARPLRPRPVQRPDGRGDRQRRQDHHQGDAADHPVRRRADPCGPRLLQQPLGRAADAGAAAGRRRRSAWPRSAPTTPARSRRWPGWCGRTSPSSPASRPPISAISAAWRRSPPRRPPSATGWSPAASPCCRRTCATLAPAAARCSAASTIERAASDADGSDVAAPCAGRRVRVPAARAGPAHGDERAGRADRRRRAGDRRACRASPASARWRDGARGVHLPAGITLLDESYNANGASVRAALAVLRTLPGRRVAVLGDMLELGSARPGGACRARPRGRRGRRPAVRVRPADARSVRRGARRPAWRLRRGFGRTRPARRRPRRPGDAVLVKGSLGSRMAVVVRALEGAA